MEKIKNFLKDKTWKKIFIRIIFIIIWLLYFITLYYILRYSNLHPLINILCIVLSPLVFYLTSNEILEKIDEEIDDEKYNLNN